MAHKANIALLDFAGLGLAVLMGAIVALFGLPAFLISSTVDLVYQGAQALRRKLAA